MKRYLIALLLPCALCMAWMARAEDAPLRGFVPWNVLRYDRVYALDAAVVSLAPGYEVIAGAWMYGLPERAFLLLGSEGEDTMRLAVAARVEGGAYRVVA